MADKKLSRMECETQIAGLLRQIVDVYHQFNPEGNYITFYYLNQNDDNYIHFDDASESNEYNARINYSDWNGKYKKEEAV